MLQVDAEDSGGRRKLFLMSAAPVFDKADGSLKGYRGAATDITELTRREESLRSAKEDAEVDYAEERRLLFVGMTRATTRLTLYTAAKRTLRGEFTECSPSPFLASVEAALLDRRGGEDRGRARRRPRAQQTTLF